MNTYSFDVKFFTFCPKFSPDSYVEFLKKLFRYNFSEIFEKPRHILKFFETSPYFLQFYSRFILRWKIPKRKSHKYFHMLFASCWGGTSRNKSQKGRYKEEKPRLFFRKTGFVHSRSGSYYALFLGSFGLKNLPDIRHCVYWVLTEIWAPDSSHKILNKFYIRHY